MDAYSVTESIAHNFGDKTVRTFGERAPELTIMAGLFACIHIDVAALIASRLGLGGWGNGDAIEPQAIRS